MKNCFPFRILSLLLVVSYLFSQPADAQSTGKFPVRFHGFLLGNFAARTGEPGEKEGGRFLWADERLRLEAAGKTGTGSLAFLLQGDLFHDAVANQPDGELREGYLDYSRSWLDLRLGRQIVTWGVGDLLFINDVFPKDWNAFFSGRPLEYLKVGVDAAKLRVATPAFNADLVVIPFFTPDNLPSPKRFFFFDPFAEVQNRSVREPATTAGNSEFALRISGRAFESDISLYAYRGHWRQPTFRADQLPLPTELHGFYPRLGVYGASAQRNVGAGLLSVEVGYDDSLDDRRGTDPAIPNSEFRTLVGYQRQLASELTIGAQYYTESLMDYETYKASLPAGFPPQDRTRHLLTVRLTQFLKYQTWKLSLLTFYNPSDQDFLLIPEIWHALNDRLSLAVGGTVFGGQRPDTFFGQFDRNDNVYILLRFDF